jgi:hypothetical protein
MHNFSISNIRERILNINSYSYSVDTHTLVTNFITARQIVKPL